jgi:hypothetical protein
MNYRPKFCRPVETLLPRHTVGISVGDLGVTRVDRAALPMPSAAGNDAGRVLGRLRTRSWRLPTGTSGPRPRSTPTRSPPARARRRVGRCGCVRPARAWRSPSAGNSTTSRRLIESGWSPGSAAVGFQGAGRSLQENRCRSQGLAPERLCGPAGTRPGVAQQRSAPAQSRPALLGNPHPPSRKAPGCR